MDRFTGAAFGATVAELATLPIDIAKVRLQVQTPLADGSLRYTGFLQTMMTVARREGITALWNGAKPALVRQVSYTGLSFVLYTPIRDAIAGEGVAKEDIPFLKRVLSGGLAGGISIMAVNPTDVVKTRMQTFTSTDGSKSPGMVSLTQEILKREGMRGLWRGVEPNVARCFIGNACEIGCYDQFKTMLGQSGVVPDGPLRHLTASAGAGMVSAVFSTPVDVVKTRLMAQAGGAGSDGMVRYTGVLDAFMRIPQIEGIGALYKGFLPLAARKIVWTVIYFVAFERAMAVIAPDAESL